MHTTIDYVAAWATLGTALGTLGLAGATTWLAAKTKKLAEDAEAELKVATNQATASADQAEASRKLVEVTESQTRRAQAPVVVPLALPASVPGSPRWHQTVAASAFGGDLPVAKVPRLIGRELLVVPIFNAGVGPAFDIQASFEFLDQHGGRSAAPQPNQLRAAVHTALGAGQESELRPAFGNLAAPLFPFKIMIEFGDSFGTRSATSATYFPDEGIYRDVVPPEGRDVH